MIPFRVNQLKTMPLSVAKGQNSKLYQLLAPL
jgi:hypothetical protein